LKERIVIKALRPALMAVFVLTAIIGFAYPLLVTGLAQVLFPGKANGSLILRDGRTVGSQLIGQPFDDPRYFWSRPSATAPAYNAGASSGSNLGPSSPALHKAVEERIAKLRQSDPENAAAIPVDLVTASASGLDPHLTPAAALWQVGRVARTRGLQEAEVRGLVERHVERRQFGILGEPRVNVLRLNLALDAAPER
jgi:K+-transporting ATPase ATPase C chain